MPAPIGNQFWKLRSKHGRDKLFKTPELLLEAAYEYFEWCDNNPIIKETTNIVSDNSSVKTVVVDRPYLIEGVALYCSSYKQYFDEFKRRLDPKNKPIDKDFSVVIEQIEDIIRKNKMEGATVGKFNANIIARDLGLKDKTEVEEKSEREITIKWGKE